MMLYIMKIAKVLLLLSMIWSTSACSTKRHVNSYTGDYKTMSLVSPVDEIKADSEQFNSMVCFHHKDLLYILSRCRD